MDGTGMPTESGLSRRERQIMDAVYARGEATAQQVLEAIPDPPTLTAVRTLVRILVAKGHLRHRKAGKAFVYAPTRPRAKVARSALRRVLETFFGGSIEKAVAAHLADPGSDVSADELERVARLIRQAKEKGQ